MSGEPGTPRPAAAIILLRRGGRHREAGLEVLLARRTDEARFMPGVWVFPGGAVDGAELEGDDEELAHRECAARELAEEAGVELAADADLVPFSRWITPEAVPVRFDTRFYLALAPPHASPQPDAREITEVAWFDALRGARRATRATSSSSSSRRSRTSRRCARYATAEELLAAAREQGVRKILPKVLGTREDFRVVLPGDPDYPAD